MLTSGIERIRSRTLEAHSFRRLQDLVRTNQDIWGDANQKFAELLLALECVDAVLVFDEQTPVEALRQIQPDLWVKGGDYRADELPETELVRSWGGRTVIVPYVPGHSTTQLASALSRVG